MSLVALVSRIDNLSRLLYIFSGPLAQLAEQLTLNQSVVGSSPTGPTTSTQRRLFGAVFLLSPLPPSGQRSEKGIRGLQLGCPV